MKKYKVEIDATVKGQKSVDKLNESLETTADEQENVSEGFAEMGSAADGALGGAVSKFAGLKTAITSSIRSLGVLKVAVAATGLGLLLLTIASIKAAFTSTEAGQNKFAKLMNAIGVVTGNLIDLLAGLGNTIISAFENPVQALKDFWEALKQNVVVRINSTIEMFGLLGKAIKQVFEGDFSGAMESAKQAGSKYVDAMTGVEDSINKATKAVTGFIDENIREINVMNELSDTQARIDKMVREQLVNRARLEGQIADARIGALDKEQYSLEQRLAFLNQAMAANEEIFAREEEIARERLRIRQEQNKLAGSTKADLDEEAQLEANLIMLVKQRADANRELFTQQIVLAQELKASREGLREEDLAGLDDWIDAEVDAILEGEDEKLTTYKSSSKAKQKIDAEVAAAGLGALTSAFDALAAASGDNFEKQKKYKIAGAITSTLQGMVSAFAGAMQLGPIAGPIVGALLAGVVGTMGFLNVKKIKQTTPDGAGGGGGSVNIPRIAPSKSVPAFSSVSPASQGEQGISNALNQNNEIPPTQAFVVSEQVDSGSALDRNIKANATI